MRNGRYPAGWLVWLGLWLAWLGVAVDSGAAHPFELVGRYGGKGREVVARGNTAYFLEGDSLVVVDATDGRNPKALRRIKFPGYTWNLRAAGNTLILYAHDDAQYSSASTHVYDIQTPGNPVLKSKISGFYADAMNGNLLYGSDKATEMVIYDIADRAKPVLRGRLQVIGSPQEYDYISSVALDGGRAYVTVHIQSAYDTYSLSIIDISKPDAPKLLGENALPTADWSGYMYTQTMTVRGGVIYAVTSSKLLCLDVSAPTSISTVSSIPLAVNDQRCLALDGNNLYLLSTYSCACGLPQSGSLLVFNLADPRRPVEMGKVGTLRGIPVDLDFQNPRLYVAGTKGLEIMDTSNPARPAMLGRYSTLGHTTGVVLRGGRAYVLGDQLTVFNIADASHPTSVGQFKISGLSGVLETSGTMLYNVNTTAGLSIIDISKADAPRLRGRCALPGTGCDLALAGRTAYVADGDSLQAIDVGNPDLPKRLTVGLAAATPLKRFTGVAVQGGRAYLGDEDRGLAIYDVGTPAQPKLLGRYTFSGNIRSRISVALWNNLAVLGGWLSGLAVLDVSNPAAPRSLYGGMPSANSFSKAPKWIPLKNVHTNEAQIFFGSTGGSLDLYDLRKGGTAQHVGGSAFLGGSGHDTQYEDLAVAGEYVYAAMGDDGFFILRFTNPYNAASPVWPLYR